MKTYSKILLLLSILIGLSCREEPTEPPTAEFTLTAEDIGVTDVFFRLRATLSHGPFTLYVKRNGEQIYQSQPTNLNTVDTLLYDDDNLLPRQNYSYKAYYTIGGIVQDSSAPMIITTMDTTSHEFTWEIDTLGDGNGSILRDVYILNDTCIYVVGEINIQDSEGNWISPPFNLARWNGNRWNFQRSNAPGFLYWELYTIFAFDTNDIWAGSTIPEHWDGKKWTFYGVDQGFPSGFYINKIWGTSSSNLFIIGYGGNIIHYNGIAWRKIESGTDVGLTDVCGSPDGSIVWACGYNITDSKTQILRYILGGSWEIAYDGSNARSLVRADSLSGRYYGLYTSRRLRIFIGSHAGLYESFYTTKGEARRYSYTQTWFPEYPYAMRGDDINDIFIVGNNNYIVHLNGISWRDYTELRNPDGILYSVAVKDNIIVAVGEIYDPVNSRGLVIIGRR